MIIFDENAKQQVLRDTSVWYKGRVASITTLRLGTIIKDDVIPALLRSVKQPTFVTNNVFDFWQKIRAHPHYCIMCFVLPNQRMHEIPPKLQKILRMKEFRSKSARMGKVIRIRHQHFDFYQANGIIVRDILLPFV